MLRHLVDPRKLRIPTAAEALTGRRDPAFTIPEVHFVNGHPLKGPWPAGLELALFGFGCFWGAERKMWLVPGVYSTQAGYAGGHTPHPTYEEVCSGRTGHNEVVRVVFDPKVVSFAELVRVFFESHDPTHGMRQGNDVGTQYRSGLYVYDAAQKKTAEAMHAAYDTKLRAAGLESITTEVVHAPTFYFAEAYHQQYLGKNPNGYCGLGGTGIGCPTGVDVSAS